VPVRALLPRRAATAAAPAARRRDVQHAAFAFDLTATGRVTTDRADALAELAVRQARAHELPPALIFGVLLVENEDFNSRARSSAGALGLMQVHPLWRPLLGRRYGYNLTADSTNLAMGAHILAELLGEVRTAGDVERGLLRYNGCRRAFAPTAAERARKDKPAPCAAYAARVRRRVEQEAGALCPSHSFSRCVVRPLRLAAIPRLAAARQLAAARKRAEAERRVATAQKLASGAQRRAE
jgi:soluble lytic murein transglycosylase-like protein